MTIEFHALFSCWYCVENAYDHVKTINKILSIKLFIVSDYNMWDYFNEWSKISNERKLSKWEHAEAMWLALDITPDDDPNIKSTL